MKAVVVALAAITLLPACGKSDEDPGDRAVPTASTDTEETTTEETKVETEALPVEADYEAEAEQTVTTNNLEAQVADLEKELAADTQ